jgi:hypothetical protein
MNSNDISIKYALTRVLIAELDFQLDNLDTLNHHRDVIPAEIAETLSESLERVQIIVNTIKTIIPNGYQHIHPRF